jgi:hypothetical protein
VDPLTPDGVVVPDFPSTCAGARSDDIATDVDAAVMRLTKTTTPNTTEMATSDMRILIKEMPGFGPGDGFTSTAIGGLDGDDPIFMLYKGKVFKYQWKNEPPSHHEVILQCFVITAERRVTCSSPVQSRFYRVELR